MRFHIFGCPDCGSELKATEVKKEKGRCRFCDCKELEDFGFQNIKKEDLA